MVKNPLFDLYEKLYFHEIEVRESLGGRLQTPMAIIVSLIGVLAYLLLNFDKDHSGKSTIAFLVLLALSAATLVAAIFFFVRSWYGNTYAFLPSAEATEQYRQLLENTYKQYKDGDTLSETYLNDYLCTKYIACASQNTQCNDKRSLNIHKTNGALIVATMLVALTFLAFFLGDLDKTSTNKPTEVIIVKPVELKGALMTDKKDEAPKEATPPPPPPPPPTRLIKEGVEIVKPQPEKKNGK
jgi:flagellar basal body-associated protein FliL